MTAADGILLIIGGGVVAYAVFGGADFGGGVWDLLAGRDAAHRALIGRTMGPVWEANHVWLVFVLIGLFSGFPAAFGALSRALAVPLAVALCGIVLRGAAFVFRQYGADPAGGDPAGAVRGTAAWGRVFAVASTIAPAALGYCAGAVATGRTGGLFPPVAGALALAFCAYLAAVFLCREAVVDGRPRLAARLRRRALGAALVAGALALAGTAALHADAPALAAKLVDRGAAALALSALGGLGSIALLLARRYRLARGAAALAVAAVVGGWGVAQYPVLLPPDLTVAAAAAPAATLPVTLGVLVAGFAVTVPSLALLYAVFSRPAQEPSTYSH
ncbi:cytochrome D ubiquinol oxidase subunit II [Pilimelia anulata]|uniref:Cytochrome D ubiquinol oxidase subunit II n=1 Tax=Pilimelia anulata TaxID=53371 RepID=A0A8J3F9L8_9ACTN|nr:cytochrome d ubiquinol oxidase subunit II [Pilimelia anulata]GGJ94265.1 cytochrome D ubiquinol oxidase subunit II [Pilimelia anulata]